MAARVPKKFKAQVVTLNKAGNTIKHNLNNLRHDISDDDLSKIIDGVYGVSESDKLVSVTLTANSTLDVQE